MKDTLPPPRTTLKLLLLVNKVLNFCPPWELTPLVSSNLRLDSVMSSPSSKDTFPTSLLLSFNPSWTSWLNWLPPPTNSIKLSSLRLFPSLNNYYKNWETKTLPMMKDTSTPLTTSPTPFLTLKSSLRTPMNSSLNTKVDSLKLLTDYLNSKVLLHKPKKFLMLTKLTSKNSKKLVPVTINLMPPSRMKCN